MKKTMTMWIAASALVACGSARQMRAPDQRLTRMRATFGATITSDAQDAAYWKLAREIADQRVVLGWSRDEIAAQLGGAGAPCGTSARAACYTLGALPAGYDGGTPILIVDFDAAGTCIGARAVHTQ